MLESVYSKNAEGINGMFWRGMALVLGLLTLAGCGQTDERLRELDHRLLAINGVLKPGETREVALPTIKPGEWVVAISGQYSGQVCQPSPLSEKAAQQVSLDFGASEAHPAFLLLVSRDRVQSSMQLSIATTPLAIQPLGKGKALCSLIAGPEHHSLVVECMALPSSSKTVGRACEIVLRAVQ